jgi:hypothetical protein
MDQEDQQSILEDPVQDIASLLLMIHDHYLSHATGNEITLELSSLISSTGLKAIVSILDIERCRRLVMGFPSHPMDYSTFFSWLKETGNIVYPSYRDSNQSLSFHKLLVNHLIPSVSKWEESLRIANESIKFDDSLRFLTDHAWKTFSEYDEYLFLSFQSFESEVR